MLDKILFLHHAVVMNDPGRETISAGLGPVQQYGIIIIVLIIIGIILYFIRKKKNKK